ncbi:tyrosine-type recombinase/integrase [Dinoroseobacter sp. S375]|uniref:tyrosine-type recombinase/integrase n=1 Tax=Dinoroseobacter sp. S375 TaxID=3415136 RepID=UPI003C7AB4B8
MTRKARPYTKRVNGKVHYRITWTENGKRRERSVLIPFAEDTPEFDAKYWELRSGRAPELTKAPATSWKALVDSYKASRRYKALATGTRRKYDPIINLILEKNADRDVRFTTRAHVRAAHEKYAATPRKADYIVQVMSLLFAHAIRLDWIKDNPAKGIELFGKQREYEPWPDKARKAYVNACRSLDEADALTAYMLGVFTGQRPGDCCKMEWAHYDGEFMDVVQDKTATRLSVYCPKPLRDYLDAMPRKGKFILAKNLTEPMGYDAVSRAIRRVRTAAKVLGYVAHGWRSNAAVELAEAGCSDAQIQAVTGHKTTAMVQKYRARASQKKMSKSAQRKRK